MRAFDKKNFRTISRFFDDAIIIAVVLFALIFIVGILANIFHATGDFPGLKLAIVNIARKIADILPFTNYLLAIPDQISVILDDVSKGIPRIVFLAVAIVGMVYGSFKFPKIILEALKNVRSVYILASVFLFGYFTLHFYSRKYALIWIALVGVLGWIFSVLLNRFSQTEGVLRLAAGICNYIGELKRKVFTQKKPIFLDDRAVGENGDVIDELGFSEDAKRFAEDVLNGGASNPMIFGIDAPWGSGKTSYLNLCKTLVWNKQRDIVVVHFNPTLYDLTRQDLLGVFSNEILAALRIAGVSVRPLKSALRRLEKVFRGLSFGIAGVSIPLGNLFADSVGATTAKEVVADAIKWTGKKIIVIVDDLDRLYLEDVKEMLGIVRNVFPVENMTFILCYDSESVNSFESWRKTVHSDAHHTTDEPDKPERVEYTRASHEPDNQAINAYFEKMVQVRKTLLLDKKYLEKLFIEKLKQNVAPEVKELAHFEEFKKGVEFFFDDKNYSFYEIFIGDVRKIKRIINVLVEREILDQKFQFINPDPKSLIQLVFLHIYFPKIFKKIYVEEFNGDRGFFSAKYNWGTKDDDKFMVSESFKSYLKTIGERERKLLSELFLLDDGNKKFRDEVSERQHEEGFMSSSPIFNGPYPFRRNLKEYLSLIVNKKRPPESSQYRFHLANVSDFSAGKKTISDVFELDPYAPDKGELSRNSFFTTARNYGPLTYDDAERIIEYIIGHIPEYSLVDEFSGIYNGLRDGLVYEIIFLLDRKGWKDEKGRQYGNTDENVSAIARKILGVKEYAGRGIFESLLKPDRGILGILDASRFLSGCRDRNGETFNLHLALDNYGGGDQEGSVREMSQKLFEVFKKRYIDAGKNFLEEIEDLSKDILLGDFGEFITKAFQEKGQDVEDELKKIRSSATGHLIWQFAGISPESVGHRDTTGVSDSAGIAAQMRGYMFGICFDISVNPKNAERFVNYLLTAFRSVYSAGGSEWVPKADEFKRVLGDELSGYWNANGDKIKKRCRNLPSGTVVWTYNYRASYREDLEDLFDELDTLKAGNNNDISAGTTSKEVIAEELEKTKK